MTHDVQDGLIASIRRIIRAVDVHSKVLLRRYGMTGPQLAILKVINESGELNVSEIAASISLSQATVTNILTRLEQQGYITRRRGDFDRRKVYVEMAEKTRVLLESTPSLLQRDFLERFDRLEEWEQTLLLSSLQRIATMMDTADAVYVAAASPDPPHPPR